MKNKGIIILSVILSLVLSACGSPKSLEKIDKPSFISSDFWTRTKDIYELVMIVEDGGELDSEQNRKFEFYIDTYYNNKNADNNQRYISSSLAVMRNKLIDSRSKEAHDKAMEDYKRVSEELFTFLKEGKSKAF